MTEHDPRRMPSFVIKQLANELIRRGEARLRPLGFGFSTLPILVAVKNGEAMTQADLARALKVEQPSMAQALARMERDGLIQRRQNPNHRTNQFVELTAHATRLLPKARALLAQDNALAMEGFTPEEAEALMRFLERMTENLRKPASDQSV
ncbi:MarR family transcriptional regulator [Mitsuaria sp. GD03876]|uniref:MarR family winged helix-turn-helix transcriptional regulator n=1 Tax=Mitsuaria sp. GD03876 TaxID=2975399 RepID=UPI00244B5E6D|nr:MarR family transcriptional regulator [Mitsuaria sp. GD03876]MDH0865595.1 MarR family transcriptional regulator [Mitsuaria sp. GD03876]